MKTAKLFNISLLILCICASFLMGCSSSQQEAWGLKDPELRIDRETREPTNRPKGVTLGEDADIDDANSSHKKQTAEDSVSSLQGNTSEEDNNEVEDDNTGTQTTDGIFIPSDESTSSKEKLINSDGEMKGSFINMSERQISIIITRIRDDKTEDEKVNEGVAPMTILPYELPRGKYRADLTVNGKTFCHTFTVKKSQRKNISIKVYNRKEGKETLLKVNGYSYLLYKEKERLIQN